MNRRSFLKSLVAAAIVTQCPLPALAPRPAAAEIVWAVEKFDFDMAIGVAAKVGKHQHAVWMPRTKNDERDIEMLKELLVERMREKGWIA